MKKRQGELNLRGRRIAFAGVMLAFMVYFLLHDIYNPAVVGAGFSVLLLYRAFRDW